MKGGLRQGKTAFIIGQYHTPDEFAVNMDRGKQAAQGQTQINEFCEELVESWLSDQGLWCLRDSKNLRVEGLEQSVSLRKTSTVRRQAVTVKFLSPPLRQKRPRVSTEPSWSFLKFRISRSVRQRQPSDRRLASQALHLHDQSPAMSCRRSDT